MAGDEEDQGDARQEHREQRKQDHRATVRGLGLKWTNHTVEVDRHAVRRAA